MTLQEIKELLGCEVLCCEEMLGSEIKTAFAADLLSDVLAYANKGTLLLTGITNQQVVRTAEMLELLGIVFVRGKRPETETITLATAKGIPMMTTKYILFEACGRLYKKGLRGCIESIADDNARK
jgi:predicted transcriptional regulator